MRVIRVVKSKYKCQIYGLACSLLNIITILFTIWPGCYYSSVYKNVYWAVTKVITVINITRRMVLCNYLSLCQLFALVFCLSHWNQTDPPPQARNWELTPLCDILCEDLSFSRIHQGYKWHQVFAGLIAKLDHDSYLWVNKLYIWEQEWWPHTRLSSPQCSESDPHLVTTGMQWPVESSEEAGIGDNSESMSACGQGGERAARLLSPESRKRRK